MTDKLAFIILLLITLILPPVGVFFQVGFGIHFWINLLLTLFGWLPGLIHGLYILFRDKTF